MTRGELIKTGAGGVLLLNLSACAPAAGQSRATMLASIANVLLEGALPNGDARRAALADAVNGIENAIAGLPPAVQGEVFQLFTLLEFPLTRVTVAGVYRAWADAPPAEVAAFLERWRTSKFLLLRSGYQALHQLTMAGWYAQEAAWERAGYSGPPRLS